MLLSSTFFIFFEGEEDYSSSAASAASTSSQRSPAISQKSGYMACSPFLDCVLIIAPKARAVYSQNIQIGINIFSHFATHFFLDFLLGVCYNFSGLGGFHGKIPSVIKQRGFLHTSEDNWWRTRENRCPCQIAGKLHAPRKYPSRQRVRQEKTWCYTH